MNSSLDINKLQDVLSRSTHVYVEESFRNSPTLAKLAGHHRKIGDDPKETAFEYLQGIHDHYSTVVTVRDLQSATIRDGCLHFESEHLTIRFVKQVFESVPLNE